MKPISFDQEMQCPKSVKNANFKEWLEVRCSGSTSKEGGYQATILLMSNQGEGKILNLWGVEISEVGRLKFINKSGIMKGIGGTETWYFTSLGNVWRHGSKAGEKARKDIFCYHSPLPKHEKCIDYSGLWY